MKLFGGEKLNFIFSVFLSRDFFSVFFFFDIEFRYFFKFGVWIVFSGFGLEGVFVVLKAFSDGGDGGWEWEGFFGVCNFWYW